MEARLTGAHPMVEENINQVAVERGPLVYCIEGMDADAETLDELLIPSDIRLTPEKFLVGGRMVTSLKGRFFKRKTCDDQGKHYRWDSLYQNYNYVGYEEIPVRLIPYFAWDNRGMDEMRVWIPVTDVSSRGEGAEYGAIRETFGVCAD